jgi:hypothetical protein
MGLVEDAVAERVEGGRPGRARAVIAAVVVGAIAAVIAYRLLRSGGDEAT